MQFIFVVDAAWDQLIYLYIYIYGVKQSDDKTLWAIET